MTKRIMREVALLIVLLATWAESGFAQSLPTQRELVLFEYNRARTSEMLGDLRLAAAQYRRLMKRDDPDGQFADLRANAGLALCHVEIKLRQFDRATEACQQTIQMEDAPLETKNLARQFLDRLKNMQ